MATQLTTSRTCRTHTCAGSRQRPAPAVAQRDTSGAQPHTTHGQVKAETWRAKDNRPNCTWPPPAHTKIMCKALQAKASTTDLRRLVWRRWVSINIAPPNTPATRHQARNTYVDAEAARKGHLTSTPKLRGGDIGTTTPETLRKTASCQPRTCLHPSETKLSLPHCTARNRECESPPGMQHRMRMLDTKGERAADDGAPEKDTMKTQKNLIQQKQSTTRRQ